MPPPQRGGEAAKRTAVCCVQYRYNHRVVTCEDILQLTLLPGTIYLYIRIIIACSASDTSDAWNWPRLAMVVRMAALLVLVAISTAAGKTTAEKEAAHKAIRMKTTRQLKEIFDDLGIDHKGLSKDEMKKKAYKEDAIARWEEKYPEKKKKPRPPGAGTGGGYPDMGGGQYDDLLRQMKGDFSGEKDPERRRILEKLAKKGMSFGGGANMDTEQLRNMEKMLDGINMGGMGGKFGDGPGMAGGDSDVQPDDLFRDVSEIDGEVIEDVDKMEL